MSEEKFDFYANAVSVTFSLYDVTLQFRTETPAVIEQGKPSLVEVNRTCNVRMSPQHAKSLAVLLFEHIEGYEKAHNVTLPVPERFAKVWNQLIRKEE